MNETIAPTDDVIARMIWTDARANRIYEKVSSTFYFAYHEPIANRRPRPMFIPPPSIEHEERTQFSPLKIPNQPRPIPPPTDDLQQIVERLSKLPPPLKQNLSKKKQKSQEQ